MSRCKLATKCKTLNEIAKRNNSANLAQSIIK